ncbi:hypothetical protein [Dongia sedimenti]|uniref:Uncharacterized protein n=1 Tax=Dongia sedimenti TaxID=3064282 RepID=A0ABU0YGV1_9PROT|nr:hypothetical protein [Rhodospirillaceae bacterium R-7]
MPEIRRILVALKPAFAQSRMPELAVKIASEIRAEVEALLAEDAALKMAADLPFAQEILTPTGARRSLTREALDLDFRIAGRKLELRFRQLAAPSGLRCSFRSVGGDPIAQAITAATEGDLLMLDLPRGAAFGLATMRWIAQRAGRPVVFLGDLASPQGGVAVFDGEAELQRDGLAIIGVLSRACPGALTIYRQPSAGEDRSGPGDLLRIPAADGPPLYARMSIAAAGVPMITDLRSQTILILPERRTSGSDSTDPEFP